MKLHEVITNIIQPAVKLLPALDSYRSRVMLLTIGQTESAFIYRRQIRGPARGFWQFEKIAVLDVLTRRATSCLAQAVCAHRGVEDDPTRVYAALEKDDILACAFARLLLYTDRKALPSLADSEGAYKYYIRVWKPGKPHPDKWNAFHKLAVDAALASPISQLDY